MHHTSNTHHHHHTHTCLPERVCRLELIVGHAFTCCGGEVGVQTVDELVRLIQRRSVLHVVRIRVEDVVLTIYAGKQTRCGCERATSCINVNDDSATT